MAPIFPFVNPDFVSPPAGAEVLSRASYVRKVADAVDDALSSNRGRMCETCSKPDDDWFGDVGESRQKTDERANIVHPSTIALPLSTRMGTETTSEQAARERIRRSGDAVPSYQSGQRSDQIRCDGGRELTVSKGLFRALFDNSPEAIVLHDELGNVIDVNEQHCTDIGYTRDELIGTKVFGFEVGIEEEELLDLWNDLKLGERLREEGEHRHKDGSTFPVDIWVTKFVFEGDEYYIAYCRNSTERKERERALREREAHLVQAQTVGGIGSWQFDLETDELFWSNEVYRIFEVDGDDPLTYEDFLSFVHPDDRDFVHDRWMAALEGDSYDVEHRIITGEEETKWVRERAAVEFDGGDEPIYAIGVVQDITDQQNRITELKRYEQFLQASVDVVTIVDEEGIIQYESPAIREVLGYDPDELIGESAFEFVHPDDREEVLDTFFEGLERPDERHVVETRFRDADGEWRWLELRARIMLDDPTIDGVLINSTEITDRVNYEQQLEEQRDNLEVLNQVVRHDIRNDMTVIRGRADLLKEHIDTAGWEDLEAVLKATENAIELTKTARDLSDTMLNSGEDVEPVVLGHHLTPTIENARSKFAHAVITVDNRIPDVTVWGNELLEAVFRNLVQNAIVHNDKETPTVRVSTKLEEAAVTVTIADNGPGIPDDQKEMIFGKGEKGLDSAGTGIGLYLVQTLVERYGGDVWVEDNEPEGSIFYVTLPLADEGR